MSITIASNIVSAKALRSLANASANLQTNFQRLSSGYRINRASDDPAAQFVSRLLSADARIASVAVRNANDGISIVSINDQAIGEIVSVLQRMAELAEQAANGVFVNQQRSSLQTEFLALGSEIQRISNTTHFNNINMLSAGTVVTLQVGFDSYSTSRVQIGGVQTDLRALALTNAGSTALAYSVIGNSQDESIAAARTALAAVNQAIGEATRARGMLGASMSRLSSAVDNLQVARENFVAAAGRIRDVDVAREVALMVKNLARQEAATAILAQANIQPQIALQLLQAE